MALSTLLPLLLGLAWLLPLASFVLVVFWGPRMGKAGHGAGYVATAAILLSLVLSVVALGAWLSQHPLPAPEHAGHEHNGLAVQPAPAPIEPVSGEFYDLGVFGPLRLSIGYYIDGLTIAMFCMVSLVSSCIHIYSFGYMHQELHEVTDPLVRLADGRPLKRRGRFPRFFQYLSLFCFSMLGLVIAGNVLMVFVFWELVGICSYLLIGFYIERRSASNAANKAFIVNRVGDFGMIVGLMAVWTGFGTFAFGDVKDAQGRIAERGIFSQIRPAENNYQLTVPDGMVKLDAPKKVAEARNSATRVAVLKADLGALAKPDVPAEIDTSTDDTIARELPNWRQQGYGYWLLVIAGLGIFCGCVGKSAQFPLHVWLPDAMEGPTPVSALIHAATMVAAGVYLVGRFYPVFTPEVLVVIAYVGCITLLIAATIALTATDIKRVLAYSTVSQLGYMMLALGVGGWMAGLFHLFTHAFFKSLLFLCSGSVIHACGTNEMPQMGGLRRKMPWTAYTMLIGCLAIAGAGVPTTALGLSGYYSKDYIIAQLLSFRGGNPLHGWLFYAAVAGAGMTAFYMFRLWYLTFAGKPRDKHVYEHAHESPWVMVAPLVVLAALSVVAGWNLLFTNLGIEPLLEQARPAGSMEVRPPGAWWTELAYPAEALIHRPEIHAPAGVWAFGAALFGFMLSTVLYGLRKLDPADVRRQFAPIYHFLVHKWWFDELYALLFVRPVLAISRFVAAVDKRGIDWLADNSARAVAGIARLDDWIDRIFVDAAVNLAASWTYALGLKLRALQTGNVRQYVMWIAVGTVGLFIVLSLYWNFAVAAF